MTGIDKSYSTTKNLKKSEPICPKKCPFDKSMTSRAILDMINHQIHLKTYCTFLGKWAQILKAHILGTKKGLKKNFTECYFHVFEQNIQKLTKSEDITSSMWLILRDFNRKWL